MRPLVVHVVGARPNYMKVAPVWVELERRGLVDQRLVHTGQHYDALLKEAFFAELPLPRPHVDLAIGSGTHAEQTGRALIELERVFVELQPDLVVVPGDVNSTLAAALAAVKLEIAVCHLESGLRSFDASMPEEHNRRITDHLSTLLLTHSESANENLAREGISGPSVVLVGNTMIDTLLAQRSRAEAEQTWLQYGLERGAYVLVTLHRPSLVDDEHLLARTFAALGGLARTLPVVFPVHPRTEARLRSAGIAPPAGVTLTAPLPYSAFVSLELGAAAVVTDSGGVQEETTALGVPCFTLRANTERPITLTHGTNTLLGQEPERILEIPPLLGSRRPHELPPYWDGAAGTRSAAAIESALAAGRARTA
jgi:UDP-N-acetylglucosamine 2-epimerase (non-hydrolysing)